MIVFSGLCFEAISIFSASSLRSYCTYAYRLGAGTVFQPVDAQYHNEFCRALYIILDYNVHLRFEWSAAFMAGRAEFHIPSVGWDDKMCSGTFKEGGKYHGAILSAQSEALYNP